SAADGLQRVPLPALYHVERDRPVLEVALLVERDRSGYALAIRLRELGQVLGRLRGIGLLHRVDQRRCCIVGIRRLDLYLPVYGSEFILEPLAAWHIVERQTRR